MGYSEWEKIGKDITRSVQDAVDNKDFSNLNQNLKNAASDAREQMNRNMSSTGAYARRASERVPNAQNQGRYSSSTRQTYAGPQRPAGYQNSTAISPLYTSTNGKYGSGVAMAVIGYTVMGISLLTGSVLMLGTALTDASPVVVTVAAVLAAAPVVLGGLLGRAGRKLLGRVKRFQNYVKQIGSREYCDLTELEKTNMYSAKVVEGDVRYMLQHGWFLQGHMDDQNTCLIVPNDAYKQYIATRDHVRELEKEREQAEAEERARQKEKEENMNPQTRSVVERGEEFIRQIHDCNDRIPGEEISEKISRMEKMVDQIFDVVEKKPE